MRERAAAPPGALLAVLAAGGACAAASPRFTGVPRRRFARSPRTPPRRRRSRRLGNRTTGDGALRSVMERLRSDVIEFRDAVERAYADRCSSSTLSTCYRANYDECRSQYPDPTCPSADVVVVPACGRGERCNGLFDWTVSTVRLPGGLADGEGGNPTDPDVIETVCYSRQTDGWLKKKFEEDQAFWNKHGMPRHPMMYFGASDGVFRIFPARQSVTCGAYDPRHRPWFIAAVPWFISESSGGRDVLLVIDSSRSVAENGRLALFQESVKNIIERLTNFDRVGAVFFNEDATVAGGYRVLRTATRAAKDELMAEVDKMQPLGRTNYIAGLDLGFDVLSNTPPDEENGQCNTVIVLFADMPMNYPQGVGAEDAIDLVDQRMANLTDHAVQMFVYSAAENDQAREIACGTGAIWSGATNSTAPEELVSSYHKFFAIGLGQQENKNFTTWAGPYAFSTGGIEGITSSALVIDREVSPSVFLGAVGADLTMAEVESILGYGGNAARETARAIALDITSPPIVECPLKLEGCELEGARFIAGGEEATCNETCGNVTGTSPVQCSGKEEYPENLWENNALEGKTYESRACCRVGETTVSLECPRVEYFDSSLSNMAIFGIIFGTICVVELIACIYWQTGCNFLKCRRKKTHLPAQGG